MAQLRAPATRADRREGGRHGRPAARPAPALPETHIRPQLLRLAVLPPIAVALSGSAAVLFTVRSTGAQPGLTLWGVLAGAFSVALAGILIAAVAADRAAKAVSDRIGALRRTSARGEADLRALVEALRRGDGPPQRKPRGGPPEDADDFDLLAADLARAHDGAVTAVVHASQLSSQAGSEQKLEVFLNLARRLQSLVHREISILDELENEIEDPDLLKGLFHVDHLATRIRRHAENLAVLGGAVSRRQWSHPVSMTEVLRSAIAEVEQYSRVKLVPPIDGTLRGHAVADVIHLLAELVENATVFSAPHTQVLLRANLVTSGLAIEVEDRGLGMPVGEQNKMNALLADPDQVNVGSLLADGRIGLFVVSQLARRHGINVRLQTNIYGGVQAVLVVPQGLLGGDPDAPGAMPRSPGGTGAPDPGPGVPAPPVPPQSAMDRTGISVPPQQYPYTGAGAGAGAGVDGGVGAVDDTGPQRVVPFAPRRQPDAPRAAAPAPDTGAAVPLPVRGSHRERPNPAEAVPGIRPDDRHRVADRTVGPPTPRTGTVRGTMGKPQLPRRRAQEHIAPQLRDGPAAPRPETDHLAGHDPGLMAAFQRGIGLAEAQQHLEAEHAGAPHPDAGHLEAPHMEAVRFDTDRTGSMYLGVPHPAPAPLDLTHPDTPHRDASPQDVPAMDPGRIAEVRGAHDGGSAARPDHTPTRHDGSATAG
ncbi:sensor histidine kinase KdpD [Streptomyces sp. NBC_00140]|uniref:sensor histidine kinase n=1 Tax=Streptomyces sp. NBC_00140 TaxID=2975664 RepID=UPI00224D8A93|nr:ATP-binding protein [Streptomyces sp. NBC_00140]MCX5329904.1 ATP-binding protein [Streptomyces sp. NBC_00140]